MIFPIAIDSHLDLLINDPLVTEILINSHSHIFYEKDGQLQLSASSFNSVTEYNDFIEKICQTCESYINREKPYLEKQIGNLRITLVFSEIARGEHLLSIRKQPEVRMTLADLQNTGWCNDSEYLILQNLIQQQKNILVVGGTSSGKTTILQAFVNQVEPSQRIIIIEDTQELKPNNLLSTSLVTYNDILSPQYSVSMTDLLKRALRLRPDRLVIGEIRGHEAKDLLMALSTGHNGSLGSMHANNEREALLRLEMLVQMGAPQWQHESIRNLIALTINYIVVVHKQNEKRKLKGIYRIMSSERTGVSTMKVETPYDILEEF